VVCLGRDHLHITLFQSNHVLAALQIINDGISNDSVDKQSSGSKFTSFGPTSFSGVYNVKDYKIFNSTLGRLVPTCHKVMSNLLGSKPVYGLRLSQATWSKSENIIFLPLVPFFRT
jgi:hypothetical protein